MQLKPAMKKAARPVARLVTTVVDQAIGPRLSALEHAHGDTWTDVQRLKGDLPAAVQGLHDRQLALEQAQASTRAELDELKVSVAAVLDAVSRQHGVTRAAVKAERRLQEQAEQLAERLRVLERRIAVPRGAGEEWDGTQAGNEASTGAGAVTPDGSESTPGS
jgi:fumarylacetoacetate (FAA) hydrolase family protein